MGPYFQRVIGLLACNVEVRGDLAIYQRSRLVVGGHINLGIKLRESFGMVFVNPELVLKSNKMVKSTYDNLTKCLVLQSLPSEFFQTRP